LEDAVTSERRPVPTLDELAPYFPQLEILHCLGRGGMGVVYKARQKSLNRLVALKLLAPERVDDPSFAERFSQEAQALAKLNHPNIVTIHDFGQAGGFFFLLMEFVNGVNLRQAMQARRFSPAQALAIVPPVCEALQYAHEHGIVHLDIKPENLLLDKEGRIKIADFGIARMLGENETPTPWNPQGTGAGTPYYMAPEQGKAGRIDHRADIYSLGVVLYELLTGELPSANLQPPSRRVQIDVRLDEIVLRALEAEPERRFQTAGEFRTQIETVTAAPASTAAPAAFDTVMESRFSKKAIAGACWAPLCFLLSAALMFNQPGTGLGLTVNRDQHWQLMTTWFAIISFGLATLSGPTILGWLAVSDIRRSRGRLHGMGLALFDGLVFPMTAAASLVGWFWSWFFHDVIRASLLADVNRRTAIEKILIEHATACAVTATVVTVILVGRPILQRVRRAVGHLPPAEAFIPTKKRAIRPWMAAASCIAALVGIMLWTWTKSRDHETVGIIHPQIIPLRTVGNAVIVRIMTPLPGPPYEMRFLFDGPEFLLDQKVDGRQPVPAGLLEDGFNGVIVTPGASPGNQPWIQASGMVTEAAFVLPTPEHAQAAALNFRHLGSIFIEPNSSQRAVIFDTPLQQGANYTAAIQFSPPVGEGDRRWAQINRNHFNESGISTERTFEVRTSRPAGIIFKHGDRRNAIMLTTRRDNRNDYTATVHLVLSAHLPGLSQLHYTINGMSSMSEIEGDFESLVREFRATAIDGRLKTERDWENELCRLGGKPVTLRVSDDIER
jgi:tRNA A-37 threonylcarbamoyl transferase component Bud32